MVLKKKSKMRINLVNKIDIDDKTDEQIRKK